MEDLDNEIFNANQDAYQENLRLTSKQRDEVQKIIRQEVNQSLSEIREQQKAQSDYFQAKADPSKTNFDQMCAIGAELVKNNKNLMASLSGAENKAEFLYEIGIREAAYQSSRNNAQQAQSPQNPQQQQYAQQNYQTPSQTTPQNTYKQLLPEPQSASSPFAGRHLDPAQIPWSSLSEDQFIQYAMEMGAKFN